MERERQRLMVMICLLALLANSGNSFAQEKKEAPVKSSRFSLQKEPPLIQEKKVALAKKEAPGALKAPTEGTFKYFASRYFAKVVKGAPYSATATTEHIQKLGDGNQIIRKNEAKVYRDGEGRTRLEQKLTTIGKWTAADDAPQMTYISDPVTGDYYHLDPRTRTARKSMNDKAAALKQELEQVKRTKEHAEQARKRIEQSKERELHRKEEAKERQLRLKEREKERQLQFKERRKEQEMQVKEREMQLEERKKEREMQVKEREKERQEQLKEREKQFKEQQREHEIQRKLKEEMLRKEISSPDGRKKIDALGKKTIEGVEAEGRRSTLTIPAGEIGNTLPIEIVDETWYAPDLQILVMSRHSDPRSGETTYRLTNIQRNEPQRSLFEVPADYTIMDESRFRKRGIKVEPMKQTKPLKRMESPTRIEPAKPPEPAKKPESYL